MKCCLRTPVRLVVLCLSLLCMTLLGSVATSSSALAEVHRLHWVSPIGGSYSAGKPIEIDVSFNTENNELRWIATFERGTNNLLPDALKFAYNGTGANPKGHDGEIAFFYYDVTNFSDPKLTIYAYSGNNVSGSGGSWEDGSQASGQQIPDPILSSESNKAQFNGGFVKEFIAQDLDANTRKLGFVIDASKIENHVPLYPGNVAAGEVWQGASFTTVLGMWFHPLANSSFSYAPDDATGPAFEQGFISNFTKSIVGWVDTAGQPTQLEDPVCKEINVSSMWVKHGMLATAQIVVEDPQGDPLKVEYSGLPTSPHSIQPVEGTYNSPLSPIEFSWTPTLEDAGTSINVEVTVMDPYGATVTCPFFMEVMADLTPVCDAGSSPAYQQLPCDGVTATVGLDGSASSDPEGQDLTYLWGTNCPMATIDNTAIVNPLLTFRSENVDGTPVSCDVFLTVNDGGISAHCSAPISVQGCIKDCLGVINGMAEPDVCGVCDGDGTSCLDCEGTPNGSAELDQCGVCAGDGTSCLDCKGEPNGSAVVDQCGVCDGDGQSCLDCKGVVNGTATVDQCGICDGDGTTCLDCNGVPYGSAVVDQCGVCDGDGTTCLDCKGVPNGTAVVDQCGVCDGDGTTCLDCKGVPNGTAVVDQCGVCDGDGTSCLDCKGVPNGNALVDQCGVCDGDGTSCLDCKGVPNGTAVVDQCGVCDGDGTSCLDCKGVPNGNAVVDQCGVCDGDGTSCLDCKGVPNGNAVVDQCGVCDGDGTSCLDCKGVPNGNAVVDQCGVCDGDGTSCLDCKGVPNGTAVVDQCGVCDGDGTSCLDCKGVPNGNAVVDQCGVCDGDGTSCLDCKGVPNGNAVVDQCGVCDGDGTSCLDCKGVPNGTAVVDQCGVCDGDGTSCLDCKGVPNGNAVVDQCGVCDGDGTTCLDCLGVPNGTAVVDQCGVCAGDGTSCLDCLGVPNGTAVLDQCGVCNGDGTSCLDCNGVPNGGAVLDQCGVCNGDGTSCLDCKGVPNGTTVVDRCGVCGGDGNSCVDCEGVVNGTAVVDQCGICNGSGQSCLDCFGVPYGTAEIDRCGICGGDGSTCADCKGVIGGDAVRDVCGICGGDGTVCLDCRGVPFGQALVDNCGVCEGDGSSCANAEPPCDYAKVSSSVSALNGGTLSMSKLAQKLNKHIKKSSGKNKRSAKLARRARALHKQAWTAMSTVASASYTCQPHDPDKCQMVSHAESIDTYSKASAELAKVIRKLGGQCRRIYRQAGYKGAELKKMWKPMVDKAVKSNLENQLGALSLPKASLACSAD